MINNPINKLLDFNNKIVIVTGNEGNLGSKIEKFYLSLGCKVYGIDVIKKKSPNTFVGNVSNNEFVINLFKKIINKEKKIDIIINNAGKSYFTPFYKRTNKEIESTIETNITGIINVIKNYYLIHKKKKLRQCKIVNISSIYGLISPDLRIYKKGDNVNSEIYGATKAGVIQLTKYFASALAKNNIIVNAISPGGIVNAHHKKNFIKEYKRKVPLNRLGRTEDMLGALMYLTSKSCSYTTGQNIVIDGGLTCW